MKNRKQLTYSLLLIVGVVALINILSITFFARLDFTSDNRYTLSKATKTILKELKSPVTVTAYFSEDLPPELIKTRRDFKELLVEYANRSNGKVRFQFVNPSKDEESEQKAQQAGIQPVVVNMRDKDQIKQQKAYLGVVVKFGERSEIIPLIQPGSPMEYTLSSTIKKMTVENKPAIALLQGHGEPDLSGIHQAYAAMDILYNVQPVTLNDTSYTLNQYKTLAIIAPRDSFSPAHLSQIDRFMNEGGNVFVAFNAVDGNLQQAMGVKSQNGLVKWLKNHGIIVDESFVVDANCGSINVQQQMGYMVQIKFPYLPIISKFPEHPATKGLEAVILQFASPMNYSGDQNYTFTPIAVTSDQSGTVPLPLYFDVNKNWTNNDLPLKNLVVAAALTPNSGKEGKMVVVSNGNFAVNGNAQQGQQNQLNPDNVNLFVNSIDWMSDDTGLIDLRTKGITARMLDQLSDGTKMYLKYLNFLLPIILVIVYGIYRFNVARNTRLKRMEVHYV